MTIIMRPILAAAINYVRLNIYYIFFQKALSVVKKAFHLKPCWCF